jgi:ribosomal protein L11 methyltransferase
MTEPQWLRLAVVASHPLREALGCLLIEWGAGGVVEERDGVSVYFRPGDREGIDARLARYAADQAGPEEPVRWSWEHVGKGWEDAWKAFFRPAQLSHRLAVCPSWESFSPPDPQVRVLRLDPGRAFGTGTHETTRLCLRLLDELIGASPPSAFLDVGCGSGILSIAALRLGVPRAVALDIDPLAAESTRENAAANGVGERLHAVCGDLRSLRGTYPLVAANILYQVLLGLAPLLTARVAPGGRLLLSGLLVHELPSAMAVYGALGMGELCRAQDGEWGALVLTASPRWAAPQ